MLTMEGVEIKSVKFRSCFGAGRIHKIIVLHIIR